jgi:hypothetical protein
MSHDHEDKFARLVASRLAEAERLTGHHFTELHRLIDEKGAVEAARLLLNPASTGAFTYGFRLLAAAKLLALSIEQAALDCAHFGLFTDEQLSKARAQIIISKMLSEASDRKRDRESRA